MLSNFIVNSTDSKTDSLEISYELLESEIISISSNLKTQLQDIKSISSALNCSVILQNFGSFSESSFNLYSHSPKIHLSSFPYNETQIFGIYLTVAKDNFDSQSTWKKIYKIKNLIKAYKETEKPKKIHSNLILSNLSSSTKFKPSIPANFPGFYNNDQKKKNLHSENEAILPNIEKFEAPEHLAHGFNIFNKYSKSITEKTILELKKWQPNKFESEGHSKTQGGFKSGNFKSFDSAPLKEMTYFYPFPDPNFIPNPSIIKIDQNSQEEQKLQKTDQKIELKQDKSQNNPIIEEKKLDHPSKIIVVENLDSLECKGCSMYDYFEYVDFKCLCMMCFDCSMKSASLSKCFKCKSPLSKYEVSKLREYL